MLALACSEGIGLMEVTGGQHSLIGIPPLVAGESGFAVATWMLIFVFFSLGMLCWLFARSRSYQEARLIGLSPRALSAAGGSVQSVSLQVHWIAGLFGGLAGGLWGAMYQTLHPSLFGLPESVIILLVCLLGGQGEPTGVAVGLAVVFLVPEFLDLTDAVPVFAALTQLLGFSPPDPAAVVSALRQAMLGALLVVVIIWLQKGIVPVLHERLKDQGSQVA
jgi:ABC-type branched-subunit amino acid transport system permease subunit